MSPGWKIVIHDRTNTLVQSKEQAEKCEPDKSNATVGHVADTGRAPEAAEEDHETAAWLHTPPPMPNVPPKSPCDDVYNEWCLSQCGSLSCPDTFSGASYE